MIVDKTKLKMLLKLSPDEEIADCHNLRFVGQIIVTETRNS